MTTRATPSRHIQAVAEARLEAIKGRTSTWTDQREVNNNMRITGGRGGGRPTGVGRDQGNEGR